MAGAYFFGAYMKGRTKISLYLNKSALILWLISITVITTSFFVFEGNNYLSLCSSLLGVTSIIYCAKGNPFGHVIGIVFCVLYAIISLTYSYYGEVITYFGMTMPMAIISLVAWLKNPYKDDAPEVKVNHIKTRELLFALLLSAVVTVAFYFILKAFGTANLLISTVSVTTSFIAVYFTFRRSPFYAIAYAINDIVLMALWILATLENFSYLSVVICFFTFLIIDVYGFISWKKMDKKQGVNKSSN